MFIYWYIELSSCLPLGVAILEQMITIQKFQWFNLVQIATLFFFFKYLRPFVAYFSGLDFFLDFSRLVGWRPSLRDDRECFAEAGTFALRSADMASAWLIYICFFE